MKFLKTNTTTVLFFLFILLIFNIDSKAKETLPELIVQRSHTNMISSVIFSPDGKILATSSFDNKVKLWEVKTGKLLRTFIHQEVSDAFLEIIMSFSSNGKTLAWVPKSGSADITLVDIISGKEVLSMEQKNSNLYTFDSPSSFSFSPDGKTLAVNCDKNIRFYNLQTGELESYLGNVVSMMDNYEHTDLTFSKDWKMLSSFNQYEYTISLVNLFKEEVIYDIQIGDLSKFPPRIMSENELVALKASFSDSGKFFAWWDDVNFSVSVWDVINKKKICDIRNSETEKYIDSLAFTPDEKRILLHGETKIILIDIDAGKSIYSLDNEIVLGLALSPDGEFT